MSRIEKTAQHLKKAISQILLMEIKDARIGFVTVTRVRVMPDFKTARVYYTAIESSVKKSDIQKGLDSASGYIRKLLAQRIKMKFMPEIKFYFDDMLEESLRVEKILDELKNEDIKQD